MCQTAGQRIRELRKRAGMSQHDLGRLLFDGQPAMNQNALQLRVSRLERSDDVSSRNRVKLAGIFGCSIHDLLPIHDDDCEEAIKQRPPTMLNIQLHPELAQLLPDFPERMRKLNSLPGLVENLAGLVVNVLDDWANTIRAQHNLESSTKKEEGPPNAPPPKQVAGGSRLQ